MNRKYRSHDVLDFIAILRAYKKQFTVPFSGLERALTCAIWCMECMEDYLMVKEIDDGR